MYSDWDQKNEILRSPEDRDSLSAWLTDANDDAGNARPAYIASKNVFFPDRKEIASLEVYLSRYLWGGMQMTETEQYPAPLTVLAMRLPAGTTPGRWNISGTCKSSWYTECP